MDKQPLSIRYKDMFKHISLNEFMKICGNVLGNYDDKLIKAYIIKEK